LDNFTQIPNWLLNFPNGLTNAEFRVLCCIYRLTKGYGIDSRKIKYSQLLEMCGVKGISKICQSLKAKGFIHFESELGKASVISILKPINSVNHLSKKVVNSVNQTHQLSSPHPSTQLITSRGAKESFKDNLKEKKEEQFLFFKEYFTKHLPKEKWDDENIIREQFLTLNEEEMKFLLLGLEYENNQWRQPDCDLQFKKRASVYLQKREFMRDDIVKPVKTKLFDEKKKQQFIIDTYGSMEEYKKQKAV